MPKKASDRCALDQHGLGPGPVDGGPPRIYVVSDVRLYREGLIGSLGRRRKVLLVGAGGHADALDQIESTQPDVLLLDVSVPDCLMLPRRARVLAPDLRFVAFAVAEVEANVLACAEAGFSGYVPQDGSIDDMVNAVCRSISGELLCPPQIASSLFNRVGALTVPGEAAAVTARLTRREREISALLVLGLANKEIARQLGLSGSTIRNHVHNILQKLDLRRRGELARLWQGQTWLQPVIAPAMMVGSLLGAL
ncbi:MAG TPA: response regulator transcription factor [Stellaceae bacterium]|nr:response regulator transcription factor [Stellaceae bacterium]